MTLRGALTVGLLAFVSLAAGLLPGHSRDASAYGPYVTVTVRHPDAGIGCVGPESWTGQIEDLVKQTLPQEWGGHDVPPHPIDAFRAGASAIRQDYWYYYKHPADYFPPCPGVAPFAYNLNRQQLAFTPGDAAVLTAQATDETVAKGWAPYGSNNPDDTFLSFGSELQEDTWVQANGYPWMPIVSSASWPPGEWASNACCPGGSGNIGVVTPLGSACLYDCTLDYDSDSVVNFYDNCVFAPNGAQTNNDAAGGYPWIKDGSPLEGDTIGGDTCDANDDNDGCIDTDETGGNHLYGGQRSPAVPWDFFEVPVPPLRPTDASGVRNRSIAIADVIASLTWIGTSSFNPSVPNVDGVWYGADFNANGVADGTEYDRSTSTFPGQGWRTGPPSGSVSIADSILILASIGDNCN